MRFGNKKGLVFLSVLGCFLMAQPPVHAEEVKTDAQEIVKPQKEQVILGIKKSQWEKDLKEYDKQYGLGKNFLEIVAQSETQLKQKRNTEQYTDVGNQKQSIKQRRKNNPLMQLKPKKGHSKFITNLDLDKTDYVRTLSFIPKLREYYFGNEIAQMFPYIALCFNQDMSYSEVNHYIKLFVKNATPMDVAKQRFYNFANENE